MREARCTTPLSTTEREGSKTQNTPQPYNPLEWEHHPHPPASQDPTEATEYTANAMKINTFLPKATFLKMTVWEEADYDYHCTVVVVSLLPPSVHNVFQCFCTMRLCTRVGRNLFSIRLPCCMGPCSTEILTARWLAGHLAGQLACCVACWQTGSLGRLLAS